MTVSQPLHFDSVLRKQLREMRSRKNGVFGHSLPGEVNAAIHRRRRVAHQQVPGACAGQPPVQKSTILAGAAFETVDTEQARIHPEAVLTTQFLQRTASQIADQARLQSIRRGDRR